MNPKQHLIIIKGKDRTDQILKIEEDGERMVVTYNSGKSYSYAGKNVEWFTDPGHIPTDNCRVSSGGDLFFDVEEVLHFDRWVKFFRRNGDSRCCRYSEFSV